MGALLYIDVKGHLRDKQFFKDVFTDLDKSIVQGGIISESWQGVWLIKIEKDEEGEDIYAGQGLGEGTYRELVEKYATKLYRGFIKYSDFHDLVDQERGGNYFSFEDYLANNHIHITNASNLDWGKVGKALSPPLSLPRFR